MDKESPAQGIHADDRPTSRPAKSGAAFHMGSLKGYFETTIAGETITLPPPGSPPIAAWTKRKAPAALQLRSESDRCLGFPGLAVFTNLFT
jgi:hypothetical protein